MTKSKQDNREYFRQVGAEVIRIANKYHINHAELAVELGAIGRLDKEQAKLEERQRVVEMIEKMKKKPNLVDMVVHAFSAEARNRRDIKYYNQALSDLQSKLGGAK